MNYNDLYFIISIVLQLLIFFELRRQSKSLMILLMSFLITVLCILFFYCSVTYKTLVSFGMLVVVFLMFLWNVNYRFRKILKWEIISHFFYVICYELIVCSESAGFMEIISDFLTFIYRHEALFFYIRKFYVF